jgi:glycosyltransferase involved in cell wall biosynthesis
MKILHILDHSLPLHSGYSFRSLNILRAQVKRGWRPLVITSPKHEESWREYSPEREEIEGLIHYRTGALAHNGCPLEAEIRLMKNLAKRILDVAESERPDILHAHSPILNVIPALYAGRKLGIPVVYEIRAFWEDAAVDHGTCTQDSLKYKLIRSLETWVCRKADQVAILCNGLKNDLVSRGISREKITVVFNGVNVDDFKPCEPDLQFIKKWQLEGKTVSLGPFIDMRAWIFWSMRLRAWLQQGLISYCFWWEAVRFKKNLSILLIGEALADRSYCQGGFRMRQYPVCTPISISWYTHATPCGSQNL